MRIKKYGYSQFNQTTNLKFAVMVQALDDEGKQSWRFVTKIETWPHRRWEAKNGEKALLFTDRKAAQDFVIGLCQAWHCGWVVEVLEGMEPSNNW